MGERFDAIVVGCGIAGASLAWQLARRKLAVLVLERDRPAAGGTGMSAAIIRQHYSTPLMARLARAAIEIFAAAPEELGRDAGYRRAGYALLVPPDQVAAVERNLEMQAAAGVETGWLPRETLAARLPWLEPDGVAGVVFEPAGGYADPEIATEAFCAAAVQAGATLRPRTPARGLLCSGMRATGVVTDDGEIAAGLVINAAGPWAPFLAASGGLPMTMRSVREQDTVWEARPGRALPEHSVSSMVDAFYLRPLPERRFIVGRGFPKDYLDVDPYNYKRTADDAFIADVEERITRRIPALGGARLINAYAALYDVTPDWYPYVGPRSDFAGYADFCGGSGHGFKIAPAIAAELARWLVDGAVAPDFAQLSYDRVAGGRLFVQAYGGNRG